MRADRASWTAAEVARKIAGLGYDAGLATLLPPGAAASTQRLLAACGSWPPWLRVLARSRVMQRLGYRLGNAIGGHPAHFAVRKRFVEDEVRAALATGAAAVLVIGAGYDTLALRLSGEHPGEAFVEVDHPATHAVKRAAVDAIGAARPNLHLVPADLGTVPLDQALAPLGWDAGRRSVVVAEGVLMYLAPEAVADFFERVRSLTCPGSRLVFTWVRGAGGVPDLGRWGRVGSAVMAWTGEPWRWIVPDTAVLAAFLGGLGWIVRPDPMRFDPMLRYVEPAGIDHRGWVRAPEEFAVAERA